MHFDPDNVYIINDIIDVPFFLYRKSIQELEQYCSQHKEYYISANSLDAMKKYHENKTSILLEILDQQRRARQHLATIKYILLIPILLTALLWVLGMIGGVGIWYYLFG